MGSNHPITLISIAIVAEDGREFYAINDAWYSWFNKPSSSDWVKENVLSKLPTNADANMISGGSPRLAWEMSRVMPFRLINPEIMAFIGNDPKPEFWGYYADYDWVVFCQIFGDMMHLPKGWPMYCRDLKQIVDEIGNPKLPDMPNCIEHHALYDARETKFRYDWLVRGI